MRGFGKLRIFYLRRFRENIGRGDCEMSLPVRRIKHKEEKNMNKFKKLLAVLVCAAMALAVMPGVALAAGVPSGLEYDLYDDQVEITGYTGDAAELEIPAEIEGLPVTTIGNYAFEGCTGLTSVTIPSSVTSIGYSAFENCESLTSVTIPGNVGTINNGAFEGCTGLSEITINDGVRRINNWAFADCTSLTSVIIPDVMIP